MVVIKLSKNYIQLSGNIIMVLTTQLQQYISENNPEHNISDANCDTEVFAKGKPIIILDGRHNEVELLISAVAAMTRIRVDWHYSGGRAQVLYLGTKTEHLVLSSFFIRNKVNKISLHAKTINTLSQEWKNLLFDETKIFKVNTIESEYTNLELGWELCVDDIQLDFIAQLLENLIEKHEVIMEVRTIWLPCENVFLLRNIEYGGTGLYRAPVA